MDKTLYIFDTRDAVWKSALRDLISFGGLVATAVALNTLMSPSAWLNAVLAISWFLWVCGLGHQRRHRMTPSAARQWLDENFPNIATDPKEPTS